MMEPDRRKKALAEQKAQIEIICQKGAEEAVRRHLNVSKITWSRWKNGEQYAFDSDRRIIVRLANRLKNEPAQVTNPYTSEMYKRRSRKEHNSSLRAAGLYPVKAKHATIEKWLKVTGGREKALCEIIGIDVFTLKKLTGTAPHLRLYISTYDKLGKFSAEFNKGKYRRPRTRILRLWLSVLGKNKIRAGFESRDESRAKIVKEFSEITGLNRRTIRRYLEPLVLEKPINLKNLAKLEKALPEYLSRAGKERGRN